MSDFLKILLIVHVMTGILAVVANYAILILILKKNIPKKATQLWAITFPVLSVISWLSAGYYYVEYYGDNVKPIIKAGDYAWAHSLVMEFKEHVFLFLPILSIVIGALLLVGLERIQKDKKLKDAVVMITLLSVILGSIITVSGVVISGAAR